MQRHNNEHDAVLAPFEARSRPIHLIRRLPASLRLCAHTRPIDFWNWPK